MRIERSISEELAEYWCDADFDWLPPEVVAKAKILMLDNLGCCIAGSHSELAVVALRGLEKCAQFPRVPRAAADGREGADGRYPGGLHPRRLDALGRRPREGARHERRVEEPGEPALRRDRRAGDGLPRAPAGGRLALPLDRRHLSEGAAERADRLGGGDRRGRRQHRRAPRSARHGHRARRRPSRSGWSSCASSPAAACAA